MFKSASSQARNAHGFLSIGEVARRAGRASSSIRYYEEIGLIPEPVRASGRRQYHPDIVRTLAVIETAQRAGLNLDEIRLLLDASGNDAAATERLRDVAERKLPELETLIERAELVRRWLEDAACCTWPTRRLPALRRAGSASRARALAQLTVVVRDAGTEGSSSLVL